MVKKGYKLKPFQEDIKDSLYKFITEKPHKTAVNGSSPGTGKTAVALSIMDQLIEDEGVENVLIVCPPGVATIWPKELEKFSTTLTVDSFSTALSGKGVPPADPDKKILLTSFHMLQNQKVRHAIGKFSADLIIVDECHKAKNIKSKTTKYVSDLYKMGEYNLWQSGTIVTNSYQDLYPILSLTLPEEYNNEWWFKNKFCEWEWSYRKGGKKGKSFFGGKNAPILKEVMRREFFDKVPDEIADAELPEAKMQEIELDCGDLTLPVYREGANSYIDRFFKGEVKGHAVTAHFNEIRQQVAEEKVILSEEVIVPYIVAYGKAIIYCYHHRTMDLAMERYKRWGAIRLDGSSANKDMLVDNFRNNPDRQVLVAQMEVVVGMDGLQDCCSQCFFIETNYSPSDIDQAIKRIQRIGQSEEDVRVVFFLAKGTYDDRVVEIVKSKRKIIKDLNEKK